jgi:hypothetical protein
MVCALKNPIRIFIAPKLGNPPGAEPLKLLPTYDAAAMPSRRDGRQPCRKV